MPSKLTPRLTLIVVATMFLLPLVLAWLMITGVVDLGPSGARNFGRLLQPPIPVRSVGDTMDAEGWQGHWVVLRVVEQPCTRACLDAAADLRQVHRALGRHQARVQLLLLHDLDDPGALQALYPNFQLVKRTSQADGYWHRLQSAAEQAGIGGSLAGSIWLIDPMGNAMMFYPPGEDPNHIKQDLQRLLTWSKADEATGPAGAGRP